MSELAINARAKAREKVERLTRTPKGDIDASGWREPLGEQDRAPGLQTGPRPVSRRQFRAGGTVHGGKFAHAGRKPRASGGMTANEFQNRNMKSANEEREGPKHLGGMKGGGRAHRDAGGRLSTDLGSVRVGNKGHSSKPAQRLAESAMRMTSKQGSDPYNSQPSQASNYGKLWNLKGGSPSRATGGRAHKATGGNMTAMALPQAFTPVARAAGGKAEHGKGCSCAKCDGGRVGKAAGGASYGGTRPMGGRIARASGGRSKKGTTVNIIIAPGGGGAPKPMMPPPSAMPPSGGPVGLHQGMPPAPPPGMPPGGAPPPMGPPMMRKSGGRIDTGAGGGLARLAKVKAYGETPVGGPSPKPVGAPSPVPRRNGGRTNYPINTGSGGGEARLAKIRAYGP